jgi:hypothetical protein
MMDLPDVDAGTADRSGSAIAIKSRQEMVMKGIALQSLMMVRVAAVLSVPLRSSSLGALRSLDCAAVGCAALTMHLFWSYVVPCRA